MSAVVEMLPYLGAVVVIIGSSYHVSFYRKAILLVEQRGLPVSEYRIRLSLFGSGGCVKNIKLVRQQYENQLSNEEEALLNRSVQAYNASLAVVVPLVLFVLLSLAKGLVAQ